MTTITLPFHQVRNNIPVVSFPLVGGGRLNAIVDTGAERSMYDVEMEKQFPGTFLSTALMGICRFTGVSGGKEVDYWDSKICLDVEQGEKEGVKVMLEATKVDLSHVFKSMTGDGVGPDSLSMIIGIDFLSNNNARIDLKKNAMKLYIKKKG